ncbi:hypothetical protein, partial [Streptomyces sp. NPDC006863]|uniref:hypothetical protein n=1 Tax=Streptomyces sp. NPDC006863 TaxID=3154779 RepID=UPI0034088365
MESAPPPATSGSAGSAASAAATRAAASVPADRYDLCDEHGKRFRDQLRAALAPSADAALAA